MNLITLILTVAILFGLTDFLTERYPRLQRDIYWIAWSVITFLFTIKYYYGADIASYVPFYENMQSPSSLLTHPDENSKRFEIGYALFCSILKSWGVSFYWMTAIISLFYFTVIAVLFTRIERKRSFALAILVVLDYNCIFATYRQCLAIGCFVLMVICLQDRKYLWAILLAVLTASFHKSGAFVVSVVLLYYLVRGKWVSASLYQLIFVVLILVFMLPIANISSSFVTHLPLPSSYIDSLQHHLGLGRQIQIVFIAYAVTLITVTHFSQFKRMKAGGIAAAALVGLAFVAVMYQYYYLLWRIRSYFIPIVIVYAFNLIQQAEDEHKHVPHGAFIKQCSSMILLLYLAYSTYTFHRSASAMKYPIYASSTVFDLIDHRSSDIRNAQLKQARTWWREEWMKDDHNKVNR